MVLYTIAAPSTFIIKDGNPTTNISLTCFKCILKYFKPSSTFCFWNISTKNASIVDTVYPITVAIAAPLTPIGLNPKYPKISIGSNIKFVKTPAIWKHMGASIFPVPCNTFCIQICTAHGIAINTHISIYAIAKSTVSGSLVNESINPFIIFIVMRVTILLTTNDTTIPFATIVFAFSSSFSPRYFATSTLTPTPIQIAIAI